VAVNKKNGFAAPYRSQTFQNQANTEIGKNGLLEISSAPYIDAGDIKIPPFKFVQNGLLVEVTEEKTLNGPITLQAPYFLIVSSPNAINTDNLLFSLAKTPEDINDNVVIIALWDGLEWRLPEQLSTKSLIEYRHKEKLDFSIIGPVSGLATSVEPTQFVNSAGFLVDVTGEKINLESVASFPKPDTDPDGWSRIDRIVYRRPLDSDNRIGTRKYILGGTYTSGTKAIHQTQFVTSGLGKAHTNFKILFSNDNTLNMIYSEGYGESFSLSLIRYSSDRTTEILPSVSLISDAESDQFGCALGSDGNLHLAYLVDGNIKWQKFDITDGSALASATTIYNSSITGYVAKTINLATDPNFTKLFYTFSIEQGPSINNLFFATSNFSGAVLQSTKQLTTGNYNISEHDLCVSDDLWAYVAFADAATTRAYYGILDDIGDLIGATTFTLVSENVDGGTLGINSHNASLPKIRVSDNKEFFVFFRQLIVGKYKLAVWNSGSAITKNWINSSESIDFYDVAVEDALNRFDLTLYDSVAATLKYVKTKNTTVLMTVSLYSSAISKTISAIDELGSLVHAWADALPGTYSNAGTPQTVANIGPATVVGSLSTVVLTNSDLLLHAGTYTPKIGDAFTISGSASGNDGTYYVDAVELISLNSPNDIYAISITTTFPGTESPAVSVTAQFAQPNGNAASFIKSVSEVDEPTAIKTDVLSSDNLLTRLLFPDDLVVNSIPYLKDTPGINSDTVGIWGASVSIDWGSTAPNSLTLAGGLHVFDILNNIDHVIADGTYPLNDGDAIFITLDDVGGAATPQIVPLQFLPWSDPIFVLGFIKSGEFNPLHLKVGGVGQIDAGETIVVGEDMPTTIRNRLGITSETTYLAYTNTYKIDAADSYPVAISKLDKGIEDLDSDLTDLFDQYRITPHETDANKARVLSVDRTLLNGSIISEILKSRFVNFDGAVVNFTTGVITKSDGLTPLGLNFTPATIPSGQYLWYSFSVRQTDYTATNKVNVEIRVGQGLTADADPDVAPFPTFKPGVKIGAVLIYNNSGSLEVYRIRVAPFASGDVSDASGMGGRPRQILRGGGVIDFISDTLYWGSDFEIVDVFFAMGIIPAGSLASISENDILYVKWPEPQLLAQNGGATGLVTMDSTEGLSDNDSVVLGSSTSGQVGGYVFGTPTANTLLVDDGAGNVLDLSGLLVSDGAWIQKTNLTMLKGQENVGDLKPDEFGQIDPSIYIIGQRYGNQIVTQYGEIWRRIWTYEESYLLVTPYVFDDTLTLPTDSRNSGALKTYTVGRGELQVWVNGIKWNNQQVALTALFTHDGYNSSSGWLDVPDSVDCSRLMPEDIVVDDTGAEFPILGKISNVTGAKGFYLATGLTVSTTCTVVRQDYAEDGDDGDVTDTIVLKRPLPENAIVVFRIEPRLSATGTSGGSGGGGSLQSAYNAGASITVTLGNPITISGPAGMKLLRVLGDIEVTGLIDPKGITFTPQTDAPESDQSVMWLDNTGVVRFTNTLSKTEKVTNQIGFEKNYTNNTGSPLAKGRVVTKNGVGNVRYASWTSEGLSRAIGIITDNGIANGVSGKVQKTGFIESGIITSSCFTEGSLPDDGSRVWLSNNGMLTVTGPTEGSGLAEVVMGVWDDGGLNLQITILGVA
jgi:hypothetical protein